MISLFGTYGSFFSLRGELSLLKIFLEFRVSRRCRSIVSAGSYLYGRVLGNMADKRDFYGGLWATDIRITNVNMNFS